MHESEVLLVGVAHLLRHELVVVEPEKEANEMQTGQTGYENRKQVRPSLRRSHKMQE